VKLKFKQRSVLLGIIAVTVILFLWGNRPGNQALRVQLDDALPGGDLSTGAVREDTASHSLGTAESLVPHVRKPAEGGPVPGVSVPPLQADKSGVLRGSVVGQNGTLLGAGITVLALVPPRAPRFGDYSRAVASSSSDVGVGLTDGAGNFEIGGLRLGRTYRLFVGGRGYQARTPIRKRTLLATSGDDAPFTQLEAQRLLGLGLRFITPDGVPIALSSTVGGRWQPDPHAMHGDGKSTLIPRNVISSRAGGHFLGYPGERDSFSAVRVFVPTDPLQEEMSVRLDCTLPGYERVGVELVATLLDANIEPLSVVLSPLGSGTGEVVVDMTAWDPGSRFGKAWGNITLSPAGGGALLDLSLWAKGGPKQEFVGIPVGVYQVSYDPPVGTEVSGSQLGSAAELEVLRGERSELVLPVPRVGSVDFRVVDVAGAPYIGFLLVGFLDEQRMESGATVGGPMYQLSESLHQISNLAPGKYAFRVHQLEVSYDTVETIFVDDLIWGVVQVKAGEDAIVELTVLK
jgi:hypothetical protein